MEEVIVLDQILSLETAPVHIAPDGSIQGTISGKASDVFSALCALRENIAFGMISFKTISKADKLVEAVVYFGASDIGDFKSVQDGYSSCKMSTKKIDEDANMMGLSNRARNQIINALRG